MASDAKAAVEDPNFIPSDFSPPQFTSQYASSFNIQLTENIKRSFLSTYGRRRAEFFFQCLRTLFLGVFLGTIFITIGLDQTGVRDRTSLIFFSITFSGFVGFGLLPSVMQERAVFYHEQASGTYKPLAYAISLCLAAIPLALATAIIYVLPAYWIPDLEPRHDFDRFLFFLFVYFLVSLVLISLAEFFALAMPNEGIALMILGITFPLLTLFAGFLIPRQRIYGWWLWFYWIDPLHYAVEPVVLNTFNGLEFYCEPDQFIQIPVNGENIPYCQITSPQQVFIGSGLLPSWKWIDVGAFLGGFYAIFTGLVILSAVKIRHQKT
eukprot:TRINITY_DN7878_c0_g1_i2.p1 TRINITY_DN7878_c0_g1~~TRINITY_DN7878_c0_g1_i2.p1  ORF type:complete len:378 (+),score=52.27 TRINITY_DN7878_c0_g1_i2:168-1136(+)